EREQAVELVQLAQHFGALEQRRHVGIKALLVGLVGARQLCARLLRRQPAAVARDAERDRLESVGISRFEHVHGGDDGDFVFDRTATEDDTQPLPSGGVRHQYPSPTSSTSFSRSMPKRSLTRRCASRISAYTSAA